MEEVNQQFLERAGLGYMAEQFHVNKITGKCLMLLTEVILFDNIYCSQSVLNGSQEIWQNGEKCWEYDLIVRIAGILSGGVAI